MGGGGVSSLELCSNQQCVRTSVKDQPHLCKECGFARSAGTEEQEGGQSCDTPRSDMVDVDVEEDWKGQCHDGGYDYCEDGRAHCPRDGVKQHIGSRHFG